MKHEAIRELHSSVVHIVDNDDGTTTCYDSNGDVVTFTDSEETAINTKDTELVNADKLRLLRIKRDELLSETDHWGLSDTAAMTQAQTDYRQALRDITDTYSDLDTVVWPTKP